MLLKEVGLQLYSLREETEKDFCATVEKVAKMGYTGVEFAGYGGLKPAALAQLLKDNGLAAYGTHFGALPKTDAELDAVLEAGTYAPTANGRQSPIIVAVQKPETIAQLRRMNADIMGNPEADPFYGAPTVLVVLAGLDNPNRVYDGSCVMDNLLNAAAAAGLGSCWIHRAREEFESDEGRALLKQWGIEGAYEGIGHCILGYRADARPEPAPRKADYIYRVK